VGDPRKGVMGQEPVALKTLREANWRIDYVGRPGAFAAFPSGVLVQLARSGVRPDADNPFRGKIALVGATFAESRDFYGTPMGLMSGVEIQANMVHTLLSRQALLPPPWALNLTLLAAACVWISLLSIRLGQLWVIGLSVVLIGAMAALSYEAYGRGYWLDFIAPVAAMKLYQQGSNYLARRRLHAAFGQYVSKEVLERVLREGARLGGEVRTVSVLMSDVRGFTTLAERLPPTSRGDDERVLHRHGGGHPGPARDGQRLHRRRYSGRLRRTHGRRRARLACRRDGDRDAGRATPAQCHVAARGTAGPSHGGGRQHR
jgi:hypothetical protein